jgi:hypothetical protein
VAYHGEAELLAYAFSDPVEETDLYYAPITGLVRIRSAYDRIFMLRDGVEPAFENLQVLVASSKIDRRVRSQWCAFALEVMIGLMMPLLMVICLRLETARMQHVRLFRVVG